MLNQVRRANKRWRKEQKRRKKARMHLLQEKKLRLEAKDKKPLTTISKFDTLEE